MIRQLKAPCPVCGSYYTREGICNICGRNYYIVEIPEKQLKEKILNDEQAEQTKLF
jgi:uncharacterized Zn finger protein (UPF0148 family)